MKISYCLPVYNAQNNVARTIQSLLNQSVKGEILVCDDNSDDNTYLILTHFDEKIRRHNEKYSDNRGQWIFTNEERMGAAFCRNRLNNLASNEIIAVCDADIYYKDRGKAILAFFKKYPEKSVFASALHLRDSSDPLLEWDQEAYEWDFKSKCPISHPTVAYKRFVAEKIKYKTLSKDTDLYEFFLLDAHNEGFEFGYCDNPLMQKIEGNSKRDITKAKEWKKTLYKEYGIEI